MNRDRSYYRKQRKRTIRRKEEILRRIGGEEYIHAWGDRPFRKGQDPLLLLDVPQKVL